MSGVLRENNVSIAFLDVMLAFGEKPGNGDAALARVDFRQRSGSQLGQLVAGKPIEKRMRG